MRAREPELLRILPGRWHPEVLAESSNRVGHERLVAFSHQAEHAEKSSQCAHSVSATTESEEIDGVAFLVLIHKEDIRVGEVVHQTRAEGQTFNLRQEES